MDDLWTRLLAETPACTGCATKFILFFVEGVFFNTVCGKILNFRLAGRLVRNPHFSTPM